MDREKMNEAADIASDNAVFDSNPWNVFNYGFIKGAEWLMGQTLSERLTEEERKKIIGRYNDELEAAQYYTHKMKESNNPTSRQSFANIREDYISRIKLLESIFGKEMFNKE